MVETNTNTCCNSKITFDCNPDTTKSPFYNRIYLKKDVSKMSTYDYGVSARMTSPNADTVNYDELPEWASGAAGYQNLHKASG